MHIKKKTVQQNPVQHCEAIYPPIGKTNQNKTQDREKKDQPKSLANAGCACGII